MSSPWKKCSTCKSPIDLGKLYFECSVSTCNRRGTGYVFCSVNCWDAHVPMMRHKEAYALEKTAPMTNEPAPAPRPRERRIVQSAAPAPAPDLEFDPRPSDEVLVVASKVKAYIRARSGLNVSAGVMDVLSEHIRRICDASIRESRRNERKTVMDRDVPRPGS
ncbi:MAG: hypothetical protein AAGD10_08800 [Myxococcota bacterium]